MKKDFYKICSKCDFFCHINEEDSYCTFCGEKLMINCKNCGEKISNPYGKYCSHCGYKLRNI